MGVGGKRHAPGGFFFAVALRSNAGHGLLILEVLDQEWVLHIYMTLVA